MRVQFRAEARQDIVDIFEYVSSHSSTGAANIVRAIYAGVEYISAFPMASDDTNDPKVRVKIVNKYDYKIFFEIGMEEIEILHIRHTSRREWK